MTVAVDAAMDAGSALLAVTITRTATHTHRHTQRPHGERQRLITTLI